MLAKNLRAHSRVDRLVHQVERGPTDDDHVTLMCMRGWLHIGKMLVLVDDGLTCFECLSWEDYWDGYSDKHA